MSTAAPAPPSAAVPRPSPPAPPPRLLMTWDEWLEASEDAGTRVEWLGESGETRGGKPLGDVWPVQGFAEDGSFDVATRAHNTIVTNLTLILGGRIDLDAWSLHSQAADTVCGTGRVRFPDVVLTREPAEYAPPAYPGGERLLLNAAVPVEILSRSTARVDRVDKAADYLATPSVTDYLIVHQDEPRVTHHRRAAATAADPRPRWEVTTTTAAEHGPDAGVELAEPAVTLTLAEVYARVAFPDPAGRAAPPAG